ncbi:Glycine dehydrogenase decarboxylating, mitochondrial [Hondaea fermentalgiana]|uniref:Glycine cleavage system P protein n=1 Tax=Hondaea fermentalgiana TaxID=2315210 RepID=A0A2R5GDK1_9STRA|nr:Glycine dehydrogenase decarboxylating, mitochondrial [Hondaea fermentalgiana]|eukprot:GBG27798.1 Glycine dehydrogenase decarboxylating, mitochondrial [Hondaea fermentalgiana]
MLRLRGAVAKRAQLSLSARRATTLGSSIGSRALATAKPLDVFQPRHVGPDKNDQAEMLRTIGYDSLESMTAAIVPEDIRSSGQELEGVPDPLAEMDAMNELRSIALKNKLMRSMIGQGYYETKTPAPILRNMLENPAWYTAYTPYQSEISQGRLEMLLNFQTVVSSLTGMEIANCSLLDEGSSAAEAMNMCFALSRQKRPKFFVAEDCFPQTIGCVQTRGESAGVEIIVGDPAKLLDGSAGVSMEEICGALIQYPNVYGSLGGNHTVFADALHNAGAYLVVAADLMACTVAKPPGEFGADMVVGSAQRFGVPMFYGGPHAGFMSARDSLKRLMPGRIIGASVDSQGNRALRMALQTREQFIRREKATSNICTAQALLANVAAAYAVYHGPEGLRRIGAAMHENARGVTRAAEKLGLTPMHKDGFFDSVTLRTDSADALLDAALRRGINLARLGPDLVGINIDELFSETDARNLIAAMAETTGAGEDAKAQAEAAFFSEDPADNDVAVPFPRQSAFMEHPVFNRYHSETKLLRYLSSLERRDITLRESMIPLGSCTMKLNAASELMPISWPEFAGMHPFCPPDQAAGYTEMIGQLNGWITSITGFAAVSTQPNSGATGEYAGLLCIKAYHESRGESHRNICLIPNSAHGTNPASAVMCGMKVIGVKNDENGNIDVADFDAKVEKHSANLAALMITYPSTYGKYERGVKQLIDKVHEHGGQVYLDGANLNAQLGLTSPGYIGADVCHANSHKSFAIPHGGGGPGVGPIGVAEHLAPFLPGHMVQPSSGEGRNTQAKSNGAVAAAPYGSAGILPITWMFFRMLGKPGMKEVSQVAMLNANYIAKRLESTYTILFREDGLCAHEFIIDFSYLKKDGKGLTETDVAKRLTDYGFHSPTTSWPVHYSLMVEPTESESKEECDRFVDAMLAIHEEIQEVIDGRADPDDNVLKNAPHTAEMIMEDEWTHAYSRKKAAFPLPTINNQSKFWPVVSRVDNVTGDRNLVCSCPTVEELSE